MRARSKCALSLVTTGVMLAVGGSAAAGSVTPADTLLTHGHIYTLDAAHPWAEAVAIQGGKISFVGSAKEAETHTSSATKVVDLEGRFAMPGLVDEHVHPLMGGLKVLYQCNFAFTATPDDIAKALSECAKRTPPGTWIRGGQWGSAFFETNHIASPKGFLDAVSSQHPIYLVDDSGHNGWTNSAGLAAAHFTKDTPNPEGGTIVRGADGEPNGVLLETAARVYDKVVPDWTEDEYVSAAREAMHIANGYGITSIKDAGAFHPAGMAFSRLDKAGELTLNVAVCVRTPYGARSTPLDYTAIEQERDQYRTKRVHTEFVKLFLDGVPTPARTAAMVAPYVHDDEHGDHFTGSMHIDPELLKKDVVELDRRGFTVKMHAAGDFSVRAGLDAIEAARKANGNSGRHHELAHAGFVTEQDVPRFGKLDAIPDFCPVLWHPSSIIEAVIAATGERGKHYWPTRSLLDAGAKIAAGSDWPAAVPDENPWTGVEAFVTRQDPRGEVKGALWPEEAITLEEALQIYTLNGARALRLENQTGSLVVGKSADLIVLDRDLFKVPVTQLGKTQVLQTWFEGQVVYSAKH
jgi:hypothetical protein